MYLCPFPHPHPTRTHPARLVSDQRRPWPSAVVTVQPGDHPLGLCPQHLGLSVASPAGLRDGVISCRLK